MTMHLRAARIAYPVRDLTHACQLACELQDRTRMGSAEWYAAGPWIVTDASGATVAHVSYNGKAWDSDPNNSFWHTATCINSDAIGYVTPTRMIADAERLLDVATTPAQKRAAERALSRAYDAQEALESSEELGCPFLIP